MYKEDPKLTNSENYIIKYGNICNIKLPRRHSCTYFSIEDFEDFEYTNSLAYEMVRRNKEFKELTKKNFPEKNDKWISKILDLGLDPDINIFHSEPNLFLDYAKNKKFFQESSPSHTISDIRDGLRKLINYYFSKNKIYTLKDKTYPYRLESYEQIDDNIKLEDILTFSNEYHIPCLITHGYINMDTSQMIRMCQISNKIPLKALSKDFLKTIKQSDTIYRYTQLVPYYSKPELFFPQSNIANIPVNLNLSNEEILAYISKAKQEYQEQTFVIKHPLELIGNEYEEPRKEKSENEFPNEKDKRRIAIANAFYVYDLFKILEPHFKEKSTKVKTEREEKIKIIENNFKNIKYSDKKESIENIKEEYKESIKEYGKDELNRIISIISKLSSHKTV